MATVADMRNNLRSHVIFDVTKMPDSQCDEFVNTAIEMLQQAHDWQFQQESTVQLAYTATTNGVALPDDFVQEVAIFLIDPTQPDPTLFYSEVLKIEGGRRAWVQRVMDGTVFLDAQSYYIWNSFLYLVPQPTSTLNVQIDYIQSQVDVNDSYSNFFLTKYPRAVFWGALQMCYMWLHEIEKSQEAKAIFDQMRNAAVKRDTGARVAGGPKSRGGRS